MDMSDRALSDVLGLTAKAVRSRRYRMGLTKDDSVTVSNYPKPATPVEDTEVTASAIAALLNEKGIPLSQIGNVQSAKFSSWGKEGDKQDATSVTLKFSPAFEDGPEWPVVQPAAPTVIKPINVNKVIERNIKRAFILPDPQIGYRLDAKTHELDPIHDERAMACALMILRDFDPDKIINLGDFWDFPEFGRFAFEAGFALTTQHSIDRGHNFLAEQRANAPRVEDGDTILFEGNHDRRLQNSIEKNAIGAFGLQQANAPDSWPVLSIPHLARLDDIGVQYLEGYPAAEYYLNDRLRFEHGHKTGPRGKVAAKVVSDERVSTITGHTHRVECVYKTTQTRYGPKVNLAYTMGCLCRIDGAVPSYHSAINSMGRPVEHFEDWQQAVGVVEYVEGDNMFSVDAVLIHEGEALYGGTIYKA